LAERARRQRATSGVGVPTINQTVSTLRSFFKVTLRRHDIVEHTHFIHEPRKLPVVLSPEEVARLLDAAPRLKYKAALSVAYGAGLRANEVTSLKVCDINSKRMLIRVEQGKGRKDRWSTSRSSSRRSGRRPDARPLCRNCRLMHRSKGTVIRSPRRRSRAGKGRTVKPIALAVLRLRIICTLSAPVAYAW
jgi:integrase